MENKDYKKRLVDSKISQILNNVPAICIEGPKWCGKTWTASNNSKSAIYIGDPANNFQNRRIAEANPESVLMGDKPRLIDEWQEVPAIWDAVRFNVDKSGKNNQYVLTGSSTPKNKGVMHSGAGRIVRFAMDTMTLYETGDSNGEVSLRDIVQSKEVSGKNKENISLDKLAKLLVRGGWPQLVNHNNEFPQLIIKSYISNIINDDMQRIDCKTRDVRKINMVLKSLSRNESTLVTNQKVLQDIKTYSDESISTNTLEDYLDVLRRLFLIDEIPAYASGLRSNIRVGKLPKRHFVDYSLPLALLDIDENKLLDDLVTYGFIFESLCLHDLKVYANVNDGKVYHYRDYSNNEIDAIVEMEGKKIAIEIKLNSNQIDNAANNLININKKISSKNENMGFDSLCVICGMQDYAYKREDGVYVVPITVLKD